MAARLAAKSGNEFLILRYKPQLSGRATTRKARATDTGEVFFMRQEGVPISGT